jgi:hypothetical protein
MAKDGGIEAVDVSAEGGCGVGVCFEGGAPDELGFERLEERLDHGVVEAVSPSGHCGQDAVGPEFRLVVHGTILTAAV